MEKKIEKVLSCPHCDKTFNRGCVLTYHINYVHLKTTKPQRRICPKCKLSVDPSQFKKHLTKICNYSPKEVFLISEGLKNEKLTTGYKKRFLEELWDKGTIISKEVTKISKTFKHYFNVVTSVTEFNERYLNDFFESSFLDWKKANGRVINSVELTKIVFYDNHEFAEAAYEVMKSKNPYTNHGGKLSPFSKKYIKYENMTEDERNKAAARSSAKAAKDRSYCTRLDYWINKGYSEDEAKIKLKERQTTNSVEAIQKRNNCTLEEAKEIRQAITDKWLKNLPRSNYSLISQELFWGIYDDIKDKKMKIFFASLVNGKKDYTRNKEYRVKTKTSFRLLDFYVKDLHKAIEFDGDYWHGREGNVERDAKRELEILEAYPELEILHVKELDYNKDPMKVIKECREFLKC